MEEFTAQQACRYTKCTPHQLRYWDRIGLVRPGIQATGGRPGVRRLYSFRDLVLLRVVKSLLEGGMSLQRIRRAYEYLRKKADLDGQLSSVKLVTEGASIYEIADDGEVTDMLRQGQLAFARVIGDVAEQVDGRVAGYYDRDAFIRALRRVEQDLEMELSR